MLQISLDGAADTELPSDLLTLTLDETFDSGKARLEISVLNWGPTNGGVGFKHFDNPRVRVGAALKVVDNDVLLFDGSISRIQGHLAEASPPTLGLHAEGLLVERAATRVPLTVGAELGELTASVEGTQHFSCSGAVSNRLLRCSETIAVGGMGSLFDGAYLLKMTRYTFDASKGRRTLFWGVRGSLVFKIVSADEWRAAEAAGKFKGAAIDLIDGYIHFSSAAQVEETAAKHFAGQRDLLLVAVDATKLGAALKWEVSRGGDLFPHLYAPLDLDTVTRISPLPLGANGHHDFTTLLS